MNIRNIINESLLITEGLIKSYDSKLLKDKLNKIFNDNGNGSFAEHPSGQYLENIDVYFKNKTDYDKIKQLINLFGYIPKYINNRAYTEDRLKNFEKGTITFTKKFLDDNIVSLNNVPFIYHLTHVKNIEKIMTKGLIPKALNKREQHPDRIYFSTDLESLKHLEREMKHNITDKYAILKIDGQALNNKEIHKDLASAYRTHFYLNNSFIEPKYIIEIIEL